MSYVVICFEAIRQKQLHILIYQYPALWRSGTEEIIVRLESKWTILNTKEILIGQVNEPIDCVWMICEFNMSKNQSNDVKYTPSTIWWNTANELLMNDRFRPTMIHNFPKNKPAILKRQMQYHTNNKYQLMRFPVIQVTSYNIDRISFKSDDQLMQARKITKKKNGRSFIGTLEENNDVE